MTYVRKAWAVRLRLLRAKIAKGESRGKQKTKFSGLAMPSRILSYEKIAKGEGRDKQKTKFSGLAMPSRILYCLKTMNW